MYKTMIVNIKHSKHRCIYIHGNYLGPSIENAGINIKDLMSFEKSQAKNVFHSKNEKPKTWSTIWGCGQGISSVKKVVTTRELVNTLKCEYDEMLGIMKKL